MNTVTSNFKSVFTLVDILSTLDKQAIVRPDNPPPGIAGFLFDMVVEDRSEIQSDITDHYVEDNSSIQDHITLKPETVTIRGLVSELSMSKQVADRISKLADSLPLNTALTPEFTAIQAQELSQQAEQIAAEETTVTQNDSLNAFFLGVTSVLGQQARAYNYFYELWKGRQLFTVETPWGFFTNMAIVNMTATQDQESRMVSDFSVTFKRIRFAKELQVEQGQVAGRRVAQVSAQQNNGVLGQTDVNPAYQGKL